MYSQILPNFVNSLEHDAVDPSQKAAQSLDIVNKILELQKKLQQSRAQVSSLWIYIAVYIETGL